MPQTPPTVQQSLDTATLVYNAFVTAIQTKPGIIGGLIVIVAALSWSFFRNATPAWRMASFVLFMADSGYLTTLISGEAALQAAKALQPSTGVDAPPKNVSVPQSDAATNERLVTTPSVAAASTGDNRSVTQCYSPDAGWRFVPESAHVAVVRDAQNEGLAAVNEAVITEATPVKVCLRLTSRPSKSYSHADIEAGVQLLMKKAN